VITYSQVVGDSVMVLSGDCLFEARARAGAGSRALAVLPVDTDYFGAAEVGHRAHQLQATAYNLCALDGEGMELVIRVDAGSDETKMLFRFEDGWVLVDGQRRDGDYIWVDGGAPGIYCMGTGLPVTSPRVVVTSASPNPFRTECSIVINAPPRRALTVSIFDVRGRLVRNMYAGLSDEVGEIRWDGTDTFHRKVSSGIYFIHAHAGDLAATRKVILVK
jgi:hypothetical protein